MPTMKKLSAYIKQKELDKLVEDVNDLLVNIKEKTLHTPLGISYSREFSTIKVEQWLQSHRLHKKFSLPASNAGLDVLSVNKMLEYDARGMKEFVPARMQLSSHSRKLIYLLREKLHENFSNFRLDSGGLVLPTGESDLSSQGDCSIFKKLANARNWRVTPACFEQAASVIYRTTWLKRIAKSHMPIYSREDNHRLYWGCNGNGFEIFKCKLLDFVTIVDGSRITTVPKNNDERRVINMEPFLNMVVQLTISSSIRKTLKKVYHYELESTQGVHGSMISDLDYATIDLSKASDSNWLAVVKWLYPKRIVKELLNARSPFGSFRGSQHEFTMLSPMGNGFTFEVMTSTLLTLAKIIDPTASVFGDDIIIKKAFSRLYQETIVDLGFVINTDKTFDHGYFRESCGSFYHKDKYLQTYDFWYCENVFDAIVSLNKLMRVCDLLHARSDLCTFLKTKVPLVLQKSGPLELTSNFISVPEDMYNVKRFKRRTVSWTKLTPLFKRKMSNDISNFSYDHRLVDFYVNLVKTTENYVTLKKWKQLHRDKLKSKAIIGSYLYSGMCTAPIIRNTTLIKGQLVVY